MTSTVVCPVPAQVVEGLVPGLVPPSLFRGGVGEREKERGERLEDNHGVTGLGCLSVVPLGPTTGGPRVVSSPSVFPVCPKLPYPVPTCLLSFVVVSDQYL